MTPPASISSLSGILFRKVPHFVFAAAGELCVTGVLCFQIRSSNSEEMGRSRAVHQSTDDDPSQRSKRKRAAPNVESFDTAATGQILTEGKKALYHCNYCNKDISGRIRIKCVVCSDFDLCVECFSVGAEVQPHKSNHLYRVMDNLSFPLICADWNADEEMLLLEGLEMYGLANWAEVAEHVGTKSKLQCIDHYKSTYISSPCFPLPDMSHVMGKNREELLAMAKDQVFCFIHFLDSIHQFLLCSLHNTIKLCFPPTSCGTGQHLLQLVGFAINQEIDLYWVKNRTLACLSGTPTFSLFIGSIKNL